jgi:hypothetical protein
MNKLSISEVGTNSKSVVLKWPGHGMCDQKEYVEHATCIALVIIFLVDRLSKLEPLWGGVELLFRFNMNSSLLSCIRSHQVGYFLSCYRISGHIERQDCYLNISSFLRKPLWLGNKIKST